MAFDLVPSVPGLQDEVVAFEPPTQGVGEPGLASLRIDQLDLRAGKLDRRRHHEEPGDRRLDDAIGQTRAFQQDPVDVVLPAGRIDAEAGAGVALGVKVDDQDLLAHGGQCRAEIDRRGGLANAALLVGDGDDAR